MTSWGFLTFSNLKLRRFGQNLTTNPKPKVLNTFYLTHTSSQTHCLTHAHLSHVTQLKLTPHGLWISESLSLFFFLLTLTASELQFYLCFESASLFFFSFYLLTLTASRSRSRPLCFALYFSASSGIDSFLLIFILITWFSFFHLIIFSVFFFIFYFLLHLRFSVHVLGFISGSPFRDFTGKW